MHKNILDIHTYQFGIQDKLFIDTNVWLHIYADKTNPSTTTKIYSQAFDKILKAKSQLFIDLVVLSEFMSNYVRLQNLKGEKKFKEFRNSKAFSEVAKKTANIARNILNHCQCVNNNFEQTDIENLLASFENSNIDFKDQLIVEVCKTYQLTLITDDGDFKGAACEILTANKNLLSET